MLLQICLGSCCEWVRIFRMNTIGTIPILRQQIFWLFLTPPTKSLCWRNIGMVPYAYQPTSHSMQWHNQANVFKVRKFLKQNFHIITKFFQNKAIGSHTIFCWNFLTFSCDQVCGGQNPTIYNWDKVNLSENLGATCGYAPSDEHNAT